VKKSESSTWIDMGTEQFLSVPYALHSKTASEIIYDQNSGLKSAEPGVSSQNWSLFGNLKSDPEKDKLGTTDDADLVFVTNNVERLRITADGQLITPEGSGLVLGGNLAVAGDSTKIDKDLYVGRNVYLNTSDEFDPKGETINNGKFTVDNGSKTTLTGTLQVDSLTELNDNLLVKGDAEVLGDLSVDGDSAIVENNLYVNGDAQIKHLEVKDNVADGGYLATFQNTNDGDGDGIKIKLGKNSANNGLREVFEFSEDMQNTMRELLSCDLDKEEKFEQLGEILLTSAEEDARVIAGLTVGVGNYIVNFINDQLDLPKEIVPRVQVFPGFDWSVDPPGIDPIGFSIDPYYVGPYEFPKIPEIDLEALGIEAIDITDLDFWGIPDICLTDNVDNPLNNENEFITFTDKEDVHMGAIRAQSISDWGKNFLDPVYLFRLYSAFNSCVTDKKHSMWHVKGLLAEAVFKYPKLGIEYTSGNGDYAEWLERVDPMEDIGAGDIVAVKGGKISKNMEGAEQIMAISHQPIVLGNVPVKGKSYLGNNVAFMGQIPVKIMGSVKTGDYIVAKGDFAGYGVAVSQEDMTAEDFKLTVGRAWETNSSTGPKMVNTVVGVHNGDYLHILKQYDQRAKKSEERLDALESKIEILTGSFVSNK